jgi:hypothetical protein
METKEKDPAAAGLTRSQLVVLRMAAGVTNPAAAPIRNHLVVPGDHANLLLEAATHLEELGALTTSPEDAVVRGEDVVFILTPIGEQMVPHPVRTGSELGTENSPRSRAIEHLLAAQHHLIEARAAIEAFDPVRYPAAPGDQLINFLGSLTMFLGLVGEAVYQLRTRIGRTGLRG